MRLFLIVLSFLSSEELKTVLCCWSTAGSSDEVPPFDVVRRWNPELDLAIVGASAKEITARWFLYGVERCNAVGFGVSRAWGCAAVIGSPAIRNKTLRRHLVVHKFQLSCWLFTVQRLSKNVEMATVLVAQTKRLIPIFFQPLPCNRSAVQLRQRRAVGARHSGVATKWTAATGRWIPRAAGC